MLYTTLLKYFVPLNIVQTEIRTKEKIIVLCQNKISENEKLGIYKSEYNTYLKSYEIYINEYKENLKKFKFNKDIVYKMFYAIDINFIGENCYFDYTYEHIFHNDVFIEDSN